MSIRFLIVDGFNLIRRIYEARNVVDANDMEEVVNASTASLKRGVAAHDPTHAVVVFEHHDKTWRHLLYPAYKANRSPTPALLLEGLPKFEEAFNKMGVATLAIESYEADDIIATITEVVAGHEGNVVILSTDKTFLQLLSGHVRVFDHFADREFDTAYVEERYGIAVNQYIDYLALVGDKSNNIKGVTGIGNKSAGELLDRYGTLEAILRETEHDSKTKKVVAEANLAIRYRQLVTLKRDVQLGQNLKYFRYQAFS